MAERVPRETYVWATLQMRWSLKGKDRHKAHEIGSSETINIDSPGSILIAVEDRQDLSHLASALRIEGYEVTECCESAELLEELINFACPKKSFTHNLIISEIGLPSSTCIEFMEVLGKHEGFPAIILITEHDYEDTQPLSHRIGTAAVFKKPFEREDLTATAMEVIRKNSDSCH